MNPQNIKPAASESSERGGEGQEIRGVSPALAERLKYLKIWREERMLACEREELLLGMLRNIADDVCRTVTDWSMPRPVMPLSSVQAWAEARKVALNLYGELGQAAWSYAVDYLKTELSVGYAMCKADIA